MLHYVIYGASFSVLLEGQSWSDDLDVDSHLYLQPSSSNSFRIWKLCEIMLKYVNEAFFLATSVVIAAHSVAAATTYPGEPTL